MSRFLDSGTNLALARAAARSPGGAGAALGRSLAAKLLLGAFLIPLALALTPVIGLPLGLTSALIAAHLAISLIEWIGHYLRGHGRVLDESLILAFDCLLAFAFGLAALRMGADLLGFALSQAAAHGAGLAAAWFVARASVSFRPRPQTRGLGAFLRSCLPIGFTLLGPLGSSRLGVLALASSGPHGAAAAGLFAAAHRLLDAARFAPLAAAAAAFPSFARRSPQAGPRLTLSVLLPVSFAAAAILAARPVASWIVVFLFGQSFAAAQPLFSVLVWSFPLITASAIAAHWLVARGDEKFAAFLSAAHPAVHVTALALLIPANGAAGAAWALLAAEGALAIALLLRLPFRARAARA